MMSAQPSQFRSVATLTPMEDVRAARLVEIDIHGHEVGPSHYLFGEVIVVGRSRACGIQLRQDGQVSRRHCELRQCNGRWEVRDLGATHGVNVNHRAVSQHLLTPGDTVSIGQTLLRFVA